MTTVDEQIGESSDSGSSGSDLSDSNDEETTLLTEDINVHSIKNKKTLENDKKKTDPSSDSSSDDEGLNVKQIRKDNGTTPDRILTMTFGGDNQAIRFCYYKENERWYLCQTDVKLYCGLRKEVSLFTPADLKKITEGKKTSILESNKKTRSITIAIEIIVEKLEKLNKRKVDQINRINTALLIKFLNLDGLNSTLLKSPKDHMNLKKEFSLTEEEIEEIEKIEKTENEIEKSTTKSSSSKKKNDKKNDKKNSTKKSQKSKKKRKNQSSDSDGNDPDHGSHNNHAPKKSRTKLEFKVNFEILKYSFDQLSEKDAKKLTKRVAELSTKYSPY